MQMKNFKAFSVAAFVIASPLCIFGSAAVAQQPNVTPAAGTSQAHELSRIEFDKLLQNPKKILLIDLRRPDELAAIGGFPVYLSIQPSALESHLDWIPKDRAIVTVSNHAVRSGKAAVLLKSKGFNVLGTIGAQTYAEAGGTLTKAAPPLTRNEAVAGGAAK